MAAVDTLPEYDKARQIAGKLALTYERLADLCDVQAATWKGDHDGIA